MRARLAGIAAELADAATEVRTMTDRIEPDPERLDQVRARRQLLVELRRKFGERLEDVIAYRARGRGPARECAAMTSTRPRSMPI